MSGSLAGRGGTLRLSTPKFSEFKPALLRVLTHNCALIVSTGSAVMFAMGGVLGSGCASLPDPKFQSFSFPKNAYVGDVPRPYKILGPVRSKVDYTSLDPNREEKDLCKNYYNRAVRDLVKYAKKQGGDAVVDVKSVTFLVDGRTETYMTPECSDDGGTGQILTQGIAVKWTGPAVESGAWTPPATTRVGGATVVSPPISVKSVMDASTTVSAPKSSTPNAPVFPEGGILMPEFDDPAEGLSSSSSSIPRGANAAAAPHESQSASLDPRDSSTHAAAPKENEGGVTTVQMENYEARSDGRGSASQETRSTAASREPAALTAPIRAPGAAANAVVPTPAPYRMRFADPRAVPGAFARPLP